MGKSFKTKIDGVPVELQINSVGPSPQQMVNNMKKNLADEIISDEDIKRSKPSVRANPNYNQLTDKIDEIETELNNSTPEKPWWTSKTIISNLAFIVTVLLATFGFNIVITQDMILAIVTLTSLANIWLRKVTNKKISKKVVPDYLNPIK